MNTPTMDTTSRSTTRLRDLDDADFRDRYDCDRYTATVLSNRLEYLLDHVCTQLLQCAFSPMLRDLYDFGATVTGPRSLNYPTPVVGKGLPCFTGTMTESVKNTVEEYGHDKIKPGDVIIANDPYRTGTHVNDVLFIRPVFFDGQIINFVTIKAHQLDIGGSVPGGFSATKTSIYENGLVMSPRTLVREGRLDVSTWSLIMDNARFGETIGDDIKTIVSCLDLGHELMLSTVSHYGIDAVQGATRYMVDADAERMAEALGRLPDGEWSSEGLIDADGLDSEEQYPIKVTLRKRGERLEIDLSGTARQTRTSVNSTYLDTKTAVGVALKYLLDPHHSFTSGLYRSVDILVPDGSIANALPPNGVVFMYGDATGVIITCIMKAFSQVLGDAAMGGDYGSPNIHTATGMTPDGHVWVSSGVGGGERGPWGATQAGDGDSYQLFFQANGLDLSVEISEVDAPVAVLSREYQTDSSGAGYHRGGAAVMKDTQWLAPAQHNITPDRVREVTGFGANGAEPGNTGGVWLWEQQQAAHRDLRQATKVAGVFNPETGEIDPNGEYAYFGAHKSWPTESGAVFRYLTNGGGGWGVPIEREPERVLRDVRDGYVSIEQAREKYKVVVVGDPEWDPEGLALDVDATAELRRRNTNG